MTSTIPKPDDRRRVLIVGGGAAGMMAAISAAGMGAQVLLFERNDRLGKKLRITGKGRCNVTNDCDLNEFLSNVPTNPRFLYTAFSRFSTQDTKDFFENAGVPLKTERGKRVFPCSDRAGDIVSALERACKTAGVTVIHERVKSVRVENGVACGVVAFDGSVTEGDAVILCTGGKSYPRTGSDGDGYRFAESLGHTVTAVAPSLVPLVCDGRLCSSMQGLSLRNVRLHIVRLDNGKTVFEDFGEMMFTHFGLTGPLVLSASAHLADIREGLYEARIDLKPALDERVLDARILSDFEKYRNRDFLNALGDLLPQKMIEPFVKLCGIDPRKKVHSVTREERDRMVKSLKCLCIPIKGFRPIDEAIITRGGVCVKEVDPKTMGSRLVSGLYFAGELLDLDAYTGGFNLQIAFSTGVVAGTAAACGE
ncbi:MAG: NAD(P)/FAD-dependent oxidoreductase [Ruminococcaceae bacterium]|nr:NAD(P)/FAD-dependent oxidoreductase [Oscillospiraceae bacterium]